MNFKKSLTIQDLSVSDRPREKLLNKGKKELSDAELIAIILGSGNKEQNAVALAQVILSDASNNLHNLAKFSIKDLMKYNGIGEAKAISIVSCLELGSRRKGQEPIVKAKITQSKDVYDNISGELTDLNHEEFWVMFLNCSNTILKKVRISSGGVSGTVVDPKIIFSKALEASCSGIILIHNHPSGNLQPSQADISITKKIAEGGKFLEISVLDHVIFTNDGFYSFSDSGLL